MDVAVYDTTLRDGTQGEGLQLSVREKLQVAEVLDDLGVSYIEGGWPGSNPRDVAFFEEIRKTSLRHARIAAFGATRRAKMGCEEDASIQALVRAQAPVVTVFGKSWRFHAERALGIEAELNLELISDTVRYLKSYFDEVIFDAEHFFDGYSDDAEYALSALTAALTAGADWLVLCDTNGGRLPWDVQEAVQVVRKHCDCKIGVHTHNDAELAVATSLAAVHAGATMVQGTINGVGERCGNANLISIIPALELKMGRRCLPEGRVRSLTSFARRVSEFLNQTPLSNQAYVGVSAFAHKGGVHVDAVLKDSRTYEHIDPSEVGNQRRVLVSDLSGKANVLAKIREQGLAFDERDPRMSTVLTRLKKLENDGYQFEGAEASFELLVDEALGRKKRFFLLLRLEVAVQFGTEFVHSTDAAVSRVSIRMQIGDERAETVAEGIGPVHAIDEGMRRILVKFYPSLSGVSLLDYKVRVLANHAGTDSVVRVWVRSGDGTQTWETVGVSPNIIEASFQAIADALHYKLTKDGATPHGN